MTGVTSESIIYTGFAKHSSIHVTVNYGVLTYIITQQM